MKFSIGVMFSYDGNVVECESGFHFCFKLEDVFDYYDIDFKNRYFKVMALVRESDYDKKKSLIRTINGHTRLFGFTESKLTSKKIVLIEELGYKDIENFVLDRYCFMDKSGFNYYEINSINDYFDYVRDYFLEEMKLIGFSELYSILLWEGKSEVELKTTLNRARAYMEEGISKDIIVYLLEKF